MKKTIMLFLIPLLIMSCDNENSKKVYKQFDTIDITEVKSLFV